VLIVVCGGLVVVFGGTRLVTRVTFDLLDLHPVLMFFARVAIAQGCVCIGVAGKRS